MDTRFSFGKDLKVDMFKSGIFSDTRNGVNFGYTSGDMCIGTAKTFGVQAGLYLIKKRPSSLAKFTAKYCKLNDTEPFTYPLGIDRTLVEDATILGNAFLELARAIVCRNKEKALNGAKYKDLFEDLQEVCGEVFLRFQKNSSLSIEKEFTAMESMGQGFDSFEYQPIKDEIVAEAFSRALYFFNMEEHSIFGKKDEIFIEIAFTLPAVKTELTIFIPYLEIASRFGQNPSEYLGHPLAVARKYKNLANVLGLYQTIEYDALDETVSALNKSGVSTKEMRQALEEADENFSGYAFEIANILMSNGYDLFGDISKTDICNALKIRMAHGRYNGDEENLDKALADIVIACLSKKIKEYSLKQSDGKSASTQKVYIDENAKAKELSKEVEDLKKKNADLQEKLSSSLNKDNKKDLRIASLESKVKELESLLVAEKEENGDLKKTLDELTTPDTLVEEVDARDYKAMLNRFTEENTTILVGGNPALHSKMKGIFPHITYITDEDKSKVTDELVKGAKIVLTKSDSIGHSVCGSIGSRVKRFGIPTAYVDALTNIDALSKNMCQVIESTLGIQME